MILPYRLVFSLITPIGFHLSRIKNLLTLTFLILTILGNAQQWLQQYQPINFRGGHQKGKKKIGLAITHACGFFMKNVTHNKWYATVKGRDEAYKRLKNQRQWFYPEKFYYSSVKKIER